MWSSSAINLEQQTLGSSLFSLPFWGLFFGADFSILISAIDLLHLTSSNSLSPFGTCAAQSERTADADVLVSSIKRDAALVLGGREGEGRVVGARVGASLVVKGEGILLARLPNQIVQSTLCHRFLLRRKSTIESHWAQSRSYLCMMAFFLPSTSESAIDEASVDVLEDELSENHPDFFLVPAALVDEEAVEERCLSGVHSADMDEMAPNPAAPLVSHSPVEALAAADADAGTDVAAPPPPALLAEPVASTGSSCVREKNMAGPGDASNASNSQEGVTLLLSQPPAPSDPCIARPTPIFVNDVTSPETLALALLVFLSRHASRHPHDTNTIQSNDQPHSVPHRGS
ncbi:hypothetical protein L1887_49688 [Cichorium endivia]|nr:hypothetical protein L1887_49688 [Cichorium endivia]